MRRIPLFPTLAFIGVFLVMAMMLGGSVLAAEQTPCAEDIAKYCKDVGKGRGALLRCLEEHEAELSDACKEYEARLETARTESREAGRRQMRIRAACRDDVLKFCADATSGGAAVVTCLRAASTNCPVLAARR